MKTIPAKMLETYEARQRIGSAMFGPDWIGPPSQADLDLLGGPHGIKEKELPNGRLIRIIAPSDPSIGQELDAALGRAERGWAQYITVVDWLAENGFSDDITSADVEAAIVKLKPVTFTTKRGRGKPPIIVQGVIERMRADMRAGIDVENMKEKEWEARYGCSRGTARAALKSINGTI